ncbi:MAG: 30S ribosomal protein S6 [Planctomycetes bacterium]|nr:30S ribosomal protein S6 [Planctomycetota bacterium]
MRNYEGMFLFDPAVLTDWESVQKEVHRILERAGAAIVACNRWDERRLAYEIKGRKRGVYALVYFKAEPDKIPGIERDVNLSESALRCLIVRVDHMTDEDMKEAASTTRIEQQKSAVLVDGSEAGEDEGGYGRGRPRRFAPEAPAGETIEAAEVGREE